MPRILLVEDSSVQSRAIGELLRSAAYDVSSVANGREALEFLHQDQPDLVVTDLEMPEVDGLTLVRNIQERGLKLPVLLMTAQGSEQIAVNALRAGAASYVPKSQVRELLIDTVGALLSVSLAQGSYERLLGCARHSEFEFALDNDPELISPLCDLLQQMIDSICQFSRGERLRMGVALEQAIHNAMFRGNLEIPGAFHLPVPSEPPEKPCSERQVFVTASIDSTAVRFVVRDEGAGFDIAQVRQQIAERAVVDGKGRGLVLMQAFMDEVAYNARGTEVILLKRVPEPPPAAVRPPLIRSAPPEAPAPAAWSPHAGTKPRMRGFGELKSLKDHESFVLTSRRAIIGRDRSCDLVIPHPDVSAHHCQLFLHSGWWFVKDLHTKNGIRVNGQSVLRRRLNPGDVLSVAKHKFEIQYDPGELGAVGVTPPPDPF